VAGALSFSKAAEHAKSAFIDVIENETRLSSASFAATHSMLTEHLNDRPGETIANSLLDFTSWTQK